MAQTNPNYRDEEIRRLKKAFWIFASKLEAPSKDLVEASGDSPLRKRRADTARAAEGGLDEGKRHEPASRAESNTSQ